MTMQKKILFTDLDGTLLNDEKGVSDALYKTLLKLQENGHIIVLSSGRPLDSILEVKEILGLNDRGIYASAYNGGLIYDCSEKKNIIEKRVSFSDVSYVLEIAKQTHTYCQTYTATHIVTEKETAELNYYRKAVHLPVIYTSDILGALCEEPFKLLAIDLENHQDLEHFREVLMPDVKNRITTLYSNPMYLEIFPISAGKGQALEELCQHLQIPLSNTMAAGDMENDISMLEVAGCGVAMQNAAQKVKEIADITTECDNNHDGLLPYIKQFFMIS